MAQNQIITSDSNDLKPSFTNPDGMPIYISPFDIKPLRKTELVNTLKKRKSKNKRRHH